MRVGFDHTTTQASETRRRTVPSENGNGFAAVLTATAQADSESGPQPELSSATYRLFAAIAAERGETEHEAHFRNRATQAREAGLPLHPSGVLAENGRWDYTPAAALIPETGHFDSRSGQGVLRFTAYGPTEAEAVGDAGDPAAEPLDPSHQTADATIDRVTDPERRSSGRRDTQALSVEEWWVALHRVG